MYLNHAPSKINNAASNESTPGNAPRLVVASSEVAMAGRRCLEEAQRVMRTVVGGLRGSRSGEITHAGEFHEFSEPVRGYRVRHIPTEEITSEEMAALGLS